MSDSPSSTPDAPIWVLTGPTACGKTAAALALGEQMPIEIISVDSALIYRDMDIGTAKPTTDEMAAVPHHLIDIVDPTERYSVARFVSDTEALIEAIRARGRTPVLVGGTMMYLKALLEGIDEMPAVPDELRRAIDARMKAHGSAAMHEVLQKVDPITAARLPPGDTQRIQRALEIWEASGRPLSSFHQRDANTPPRKAAKIVSLEPQDRKWLHKRIALRFEMMMTAGFLDEVKQLRQRPDLHVDLPSIRCVGYRQVWEALDAGLDLTNPSVLANIVEQGIAATRQLAKRQITWLRGMPHRHVVACDTGASAMELALQARQHFTTT